MEFKDRRIGGVSSADTNINRIKVEFKDGHVVTTADEQLILIESKWNLKAFVSLFFLSSPLHINRIKVEFKEKLNFFVASEIIILIESQWNLKLSTDLLMYRSICILIESQWNLKLPGQ